MKIHPNSTSMRSVWLLLLLIISVCYSASINQPSDHTRDISLSNDNATNSTVLYSTNAPKTSSILTKLVQRSPMKIADNVFNSIKHYPTRIRRTSQCRRHSDEGLITILQNYTSDMSHYTSTDPQRFRSMLAVPSIESEHLSKLTKQEIEEALKSNVTEHDSENFNHIHSIKRRFVLPEDAGVNRVTRDVDDGVTAVQFCLPRAREEDGHIQLCSVCAATTTLPDDRFPRFINEAVCNSEGDNGSCLSNGMGPHGRCSQKVFNLTMLRRTNHCTASEEDGQVFYLEEWEAYSQRVRVACECELDAQSYLAMHAR